MARNQAEEIKLPCSPGECPCQEVGDIMGLKGCWASLTPEQQRLCYESPRIQKMLTSTRPHHVHHDGINRRRDPDYGRFGLPNSPEFLSENLI